MISEQISSFFTGENVLSKLIVTTLGKRHPFKFKDTGLIAHIARNNDKRDHWNITTDQLHHLTEKMPCKDS